MDAIDACIKVLKKEVANLEGHHECLLSGVTGPSRFGDKTLISGLWLDYYIMYLYFLPPCLFLSLLSLLSTLLYFSSTYLISLVWLIYFGFVIYYAISAIATTMFFNDTICFANIPWSSLLFVFLHLIINYKWKHTTMLSCDIIPCKGGHLEEKNMKERNNYIMFLRHNKFLTICHWWDPWNLFHPSGPNGNTHLHMLPLPRRVPPILVRI